MSTETVHAHRLSPKKFVLHYVEMVIAMAVGMVALHPVWSFLGYWKMIGGMLTGRLGVGTSG